MFELADQQEISNLNVLAEVELRSYSINGRATRVYDKWFDPFPPRIAPQGNLVPSAVSGCNPRASDDRDDNSISKRKTSSKVLAVQLWCLSSQALVGLASFGPNTSAPSQALRQCHGFLDDTSSSRLNREIGVLLSFSWGPKLRFCLWG